MLDINISIVNWKMKDDIDKCLTSLFVDLENSNFDYAIHVVDNSDNIDNLKELLKKKYPRVKYINLGKNIGYGRAQNLGFREKQAKFYLSLNPDVEFKEKNTLKTLIDFLKNNPRVGMVAPKLLNVDGGIQYSCCRFPRLFDQFYRRLKLDKKNSYFKKRVNYYLMRDFDHNKTVPVDWVIGSFILARAELVKKINFFDDRYFMYFEDCDWCRRTWQAGWQVYYFHGVSVEHQHRRQSAETSPWLAIFTNPVTRMHLKSWLKYFMKWGVSSINYGK